MESLRQANRLLFACRTFRVSRQLSTSRVSAISTSSVKNASTQEQEPGTLIPLTETHRFVVECMEAVGTPTAHAMSLADLLAAADHRGHFSHGLNRLEMYVNDIKSGICNGAATPKVLRDKGATAWVDGQNGLGPVVGNFCMDLAIEKAKSVGVGWVAANNSNHYGIAGWYALKAVDQGLLGMSFTNTSPLVAPCRAKVPALGTNPIAMGAPGLKGDSFVLDMATSAVAVGKIEVQRRKELPIPEGWAIDKAGKITTDGRVAMEEGCLMPLGGPEHTSGYKGYGLAAMVEVFCGILSGATYGPKIRRWMNVTRPADLGQCFVAVDPECFAPGFQERMSDLMSILRKSDPADPNLPVQVAGDPERLHIAKVEKEGGVRYHINQINSSANLAKLLKVRPMQSIA